MTRPDFEMPATVFEIALKKGNLLASKTKGAPSLP